MSRICQRCNHQNADEARFCLHCGAMLEQADQSAGDPLIGKILQGRFRIVNVLGEGGMGKVYLAEQRMGTATRKVAIKTLHPELSQDPQLVARFHRECGTVIELNHPNTIQFYDFGELDDRTLFIVMEYIEGESLAHVLTRGAIDMARADKLLIQICGSLHEAHQRGVVHRDLKPENVLLTDRGGQTDFVKVLDFGIAKRSEAEDETKAKLTKQGMVLGTPPYMSPEQFSGQALDARSDIYSLGVMAYEMLTGKLPFEANTPWEWATKHLTAQPTPLELHAVGASLPDRKKHAVMRALAKNRDERQASVLAFVHEFTGLKDAQAAWTMATAGGMAPASTPPPGQPREPLGTPGPLPQAGFASPPSGGAIAQPFGGTPSYGQGAPISSPDGRVGYSSESFEAPRRSGGPFKVLALLAGLFLLVASGAAAAFYYFHQRNGTDGPVVSPTPIPPNTTGNNGNGGPPMVPTTPQNDASYANNTPDSNTTGGKQTDVGSTYPNNDNGENAGTNGEEGTHETGDPDEGDGDEGTHHQGGNGPSSAELTRASAYIQATASALTQDDTSGAINALRAAQKIVGRRHSVLRAVRAQLARKASNQVGILMQQGRCPDAQALFRQLRSVGAEGPSAQHFSGDWCRRP